MQCVVCSVLCVFTSDAVFNVQYTVCSGNCAVCIMLCAVSSVQCALCSVHYAVCSVQYAVCSVQYAVCSTQGDVCSMKCVEEVPPKISTDYAPPKIHSKAGAHKKNFNEITLQSRWLQKRRN